MFISISTTCFSVAELDIIYQVFSRKFQAIREMVKWKVIDFVPYIRIHMIRKSQKML